MRALRLLVFVIFLGTLLSGCSQGTKISSNQSTNVRTASGDTRQVQYIDFSLSPSQLANVRDGLKQVPANLHLYVPTKIPKGAIFEGFTSVPHGLSRMSFNGFWIWYISDQTGYKTRGQKLLQNLTVNGMKAGLYLIHGVSTAGNFNYHAVEFDDGDTQVQVIATVESKVSSSELVYIAEHIKLFTRS